MSETVTIAKLGGQGHGEVAGAEPRRFVPFTLPGEDVEVDGDGEVARLVSVQHASPERIAPVCQHFGRCGGCALQHASPGLYGAWKRDLIITAFAQRGLDVTPEPLISVPLATRRRAVFTARRGRQAGDIILGFHAAREDVIIPLSQCPVLLPAISAALPALRALAACVVSRRKELRLHVTAADNGLAVDVSDAADDLTASQRQVAARTASQAGFVRVTLNGETLSQRDEPIITVSGVAVPLPIAAFLQATRPSEQAMAELVCTAVGKAKHVADLFAGLGTFSLALARKAKVTAVESDPVALAALTTATRHARGLKPITVRRRDLMREPLSTYELRDFDAVVFDPPRAGAAAQASMLAASRMPVVVAVSCNPATLARDARTLTDGGYTLQRLTPVDQFLFAPHVEAIAVFQI